MRRLILIAVAAISLVSATVVPEPAEARCRGCWVGAGIAAGVLGAAAIANYGYYRPYPYYGYAPAYYGYAPAYYRPRYYRPRYAYWGPRYYYRPWRAYYRPYYWRPHRYYYYW